MCSGSLNRELPTFLNCIQGEACTVLIQPICFEPCFTLSVFSIGISVRFSDSAETGKEGLMMEADKLQSHRD